MNSWPKSFKSAKAALWWADHFLLQTHLPSHIGDVVSRKSRLRGLDPDGNFITRTSLQELAETISCTLSEVPAPQGPAYRAVYGENKDTIGLADQLAHLVWDGPGNPGVRSIGKMRALALLVIHDAELRASRGQHLWAKTLADAVGTSKRSYYRHWAEYTAAMKSHLKQWLDRANRDFETRLADKGIL